MRVVRRAWALLIATLLCITGNLATMPSSATAATAVFGNTEVGTSSSSPGAGYKFGSAFLLAEAGTAQTFSWYTRGGAADQRFKPAVYRADGSGAPTSLVTTGSEVVVRAGQPAGWVTAGLPATDLGAGTYYLTLLSGSSSKGAFNYFSSLTDGAVYNADAYPDPSADFGTFSREARRWSFYVTYVPSGPPAAPVNSVAPAISGTARAGSTLTATTGTWSGSPSNYAYAWNRCATDGASCSPIANATSSSYTLTDTDIGNTLRVTVTATGAGGTGTATSNPTATVEAAPPPAAPVNSVAPAISGTARAGSTLTATTGTWSGSPSNYAYAWNRCGTDGASCSPIANATSSSYTLTDTDIGNTLRVTVTATGAGGTGTATSNPTATVEAAPPPAAPVNSVAPAISGTARAGSTLTATTGTWSGSPSNYAYAWNRCGTDGASCSPIANATSSSYTLTDTDIGNTLRVTVTATGAGGTGTATSNPTTTVEAAPTSGGTAVFGSTAGGTSFSAPSAGYKIGSSFTLAEAGTAQSFSWYARGGAADQRFRPLIYRAGSNGDPTSLVVAGSEVVVRAGQPAGWVTGSLPSTGLDAGAYYLTLLTGSTSKSAFTYFMPLSNGAVYNQNSYPTPSATFGAFSREARQWSFHVTYIPAGPPVPPGNATRPVITGTAEVGGTLTASTGTWSGTLSTYTYIWSRCNSQGDACVPVTDASSSTYTPEQGDLDATLRAEVTATNAAGSASAISDPTAPVMSAPPATPPTSTASPTITGTAQAGSTLTASTGTWSGSPTGYSYTWSRCTADTSACAPVSAANSSTYALADADVGSTMKVAVTATNAGGAATATSAPTAVVQAASPTTARPGNLTLPVISGEAKRSSTLTATTGTWTNNPTSYTYRWMRCNVTGSPCLYINQAKSSSYMPIWTDVQQRNAVEVTATNAYGSRTVRSQVTEMVADGPARAAPTFRINKSPIIRGNAIVGDVLTAISGELKEAPRITFSWWRCDAAGAGCAAISGSVADTYRLTDADLGKTVRVRVTAVNSAGQITGDSPVSQVVQRRTAASRSFGQLEEADWRSTTLATGQLIGSVFEVVEPAVTSQFMFYASGNSPGDMEPPRTGVQTFTPAVYHVDGAGQPTSLALMGDPVTVGKGQGWGWVLSSLPAVQLDAGRYVLAVLAGAGTNVMVGYRDQQQAGQQATLAAGSPPPSSWPTSATTARRWALRVLFVPVNATPPAAPALLAPPTLTGTTRQGTSLTLVPGTWSGATEESVQWVRCSSSSDCIDIPGATRGSYHLTGLDVGKVVAARTTAHNSGGQTAAVTALSDTVTAAAAASLKVEVGYANNAVLPSTWQGSPGVGFVGTAALCCTSENLLGWDAGAIQFTNPSSAAVSISSVSVDIGGLKYSLWSNITVPAGGKTIITQMNRFNFDSSEAGGFGCHDPLPDIPVIHVTIAGVTTDYYDVQQVLNTTGRDTGVCVYVGPIIEEGHDWVRVS